MPREHLCRVSPHLMKMQGQMPSLKTPGSARQSPGPHLESQRACPPALLTWEAQHPAAQSQST